MAKKVFLGVGHGGSDPGACANGLKEKNVNLATALACRDELDRHGIDVKMSREKDENDKLADEIKECNAYGPDLAVDIHHNAGRGDGAEAYCSLSGGMSRTLATNVLSEINKIGQNLRGVKTKKRIDGKDYYGFVRSITAPSIVLECAFLDNAKDVTIVDTAAENKAMGIAIAKGILKTLGIEWIDPTVKKEETKAPLYRVQVGAYSVKANAEKIRKKLIEDGYSAIIVES